MDKRQKQLGMNYGTATYRLLRDLLFYKVKDQKCYRCGCEMSREDFSLDHKINWLDSEDPKGIFFDINNISYSHKGCNSRHTRFYGNGLSGQELIDHKKKYYKNYKLQFSEEERKTKRKEQYIRTGK